MTRQFWKFTRVQLIIAAISLLLLLLSAKAAHGQTATNKPPATTTTTNAPTVEAAIDNLLAAVAAGQTNWDVIPYGLYAKGLKNQWGGGLALMYPLSTYVVTGARIDWVNGNFWMPSGNATLQLPVKLSSWLTVTPFTYAGIGVPIAGATVGGVSVGGSPPRDNNGQPTAILGAGAAINLYNGSGFIKKLDLIGDVENWTGFAGQQFRFGAVLHF